MRSRATELIGDHLVAEKAPFSFALKESGEDICFAPFVYVRILQDKVDSILEQNEKYMKNNHHSSRSPFTFSETGMVVSTGMRVVYLQMKYG